MWEGGWTGGEDMPRLVDIHLSLPFSEEKRRRVDTGVRENGWTGRRSGREETMVAI